VEVSISENVGESVLGEEREQDDRLALAAQGGDREARNALYLRWRQAIRGASEPARRLAAQLDRVGSHIEPEDLEGEGFIIFCDLLERWRPERAPFVPYMLAAMSRRAYHYVRDANHLRSTRRPVRLARASDGSEEPLAEVESAPDIANAVSGREEWDELAGRLSQDWRRLVELRYGRDLQSRRVAKEVGRSARRVNRTLEAALRTLREAVGQEQETL
jgi:RNA polymerase sigma factor (sigma-70 family)